MATLNSRRLEILAEIRAIALKQTELGKTASLGANVSLINKYLLGYNHHCFEQPIAALTVQGRKVIEAGKYTLQTGPGDALVTCVDMPSTSAILDASRQNPFLAVCVNLDRRLLADILAEMPEMERQPASQGQSAWVMPADEGILDVCLRLVKLFVEPRHAPVLLPIFMRELHYRVLISTGSGIFSKLYSRDTLDSRLVDVISWLKRNVSAPVSLEALARMASMSVSSFHRHFKNITGVSPLQYHKKLRLHEARRLLLSQKMRVTEAAAEVGYESITQFNREYRRLFGEPPGRDVTRFKKMMHGE